MYDPSADISIKIWKCIILSELKNMVKKDTYRQKKTQVVKIVFIANIINSGTFLQYKSYCIKYIL